MKNVLILFALFIFSNTTFAQSLEREVISASGDYVQIAQSSLSYTVAESVTILGNDGVNFLIQGFQQPTFNPIIPVELGDFIAKKQDNFVKLDWITFSERNSLRFDIEKSGDAKAFSKIGDVKALGESAVRHDYDFWDKYPFTGVNYYRLRQVDFGGQEQISKTIAVFFDKSSQNKNGARVFPSVVHDEVTIESQFTLDAQLTITNILGMPIRYLTIPKSENPYQQTYLLKGLPIGTYFFVFKTADAHIVQKIIKQ